MAEQYEQEMELDLRELIGVLWRRKWLIILLFIVAVTGAYFVSQEMTRIYETSTIIMVRVEGGIEDLFGNNLTGLSSRQDQVATYSALLTTRPVLEEVIERLDLRNEETGETISARSLRDSLTVSGNNETNLITIKASYTDPEVAKDIANTLVEVFIEENEKMNRAQLQSASRFIGEQLEETQDNLSRLEKELLEYKTEKGIAYPAEQGRATLNKLIDLETTRAQTVVELEYARASLEEAEKQLQEQDREVESSRTLGVNPEIKDLRSRLLSLEMELLGLLETYTESHPEVVQVKNQIEAIEKRIENTVEEIVSSRTESSNPIHDSLRREIIQLQTSIIARETKIETYDQQIEQASEELGTLPEEEMALLRLERENQVAENLYILLMERQSEVQIQEAMQIADIFTVDPAVVEDSPISPRIRLNMALSGVLALMLGVGITFSLEFFDTSIKTDKDLEKIAGVPVLGVIPDLAKANHRRGYGREDDDV